MKVHVGSLRGGRLWDLTLTAGQRHDGKVGEGVLRKYRRGQVGAVIADAGYDTAGVRRQVRRKRAKRCVKPTKCRKHGRHCHKTLYRECNKIERLFRRLKCRRRVATRYDKTAASFEGFVWLAELLAYVL